MTTEHVRDPELRAQLERLERHYGPTPDDDPQDEKPERSRKAKVVRLPVWTEQQRGVPNAVLRGALFAAIQGKNRRYMERELLETLEGIEIRFTGMQLDQSDLDVWEQILHLVREQPLGAKCYFTERGFLKAIGRSIGGKNSEWLKDVIARLGALLVEISYGRLTYFGSLIEGGIRDEITQEYAIKINPNMQALYEVGWTAINWERRLALMRKPLALWLHDFYASHADPYPLKVETIHRLCGSNNKDIAGFKRDLKKALEKLVEVGSIISFEIKDNLVFIKRTPSRSQRKHLINARRRKK